MGLVSFYAKGSDDADLKEEKNKNTTSTGAVNLNSHIADVGGKQVASDKKIKQENTISCHQSREEQPHPHAFSH